MCRDEKLPTTYLCGDDCPANPGAWELHGAFHKKVRRQRKGRADGGVGQQKQRELAKRDARIAAETGDEHHKLLAEASRYASELDWRKAGKAYREVIALRPDRPEAYYNLGTALNASGHYVEAAQRFHEAKERIPMGSESWALATAHAFQMLTQNECDEVAKPEWWNDEGLKAVSARVVRAVPNDVVANNMRAVVLSGAGGAWEAELRSAAELREAATHYERVAALSPAPASKAENASFAGLCRIEAEAM